MSTRTYYDPLHQSITLDSLIPEEKMVMELIDSSPFQRLRRIKQLGPAYLTFHSAESSRFTHSLGVFHLARRAINHLSKLNSRLEKINSRRKQKKYTRMLEKFLQEELTAELKRLTRTEGQILVKLIFRETGSTAFSLVRELRNGFRAFTYNTIAKVFKISLKEKYDPLNVREDLFIEDILRNSSL